MPVSGGAADKLGNRYEALWACDQLLRLVDGRAIQFTLEPLDADESRGIEFRVVESDHSIEYWSVKRQTTRAAGWTLAALAREDGRNRSILRDLLAHVEQHQTNRAVFASAMGAGEFEELHEHATDSAALDARLRRSNDLRNGFDQYLMPLCDGDRERARNFLLSVRTHVANETQLRESVECAIRMMFYAISGEQVDALVVRACLCDLLLANVHRPLSQEAILSFLDSRGFRRRDWSIETKVEDRVAEMFDSYSAPLRERLVGGGLLPVPGGEAVLGPDSRPRSQRILVVGGAGGGKSCALLAAAERMRGAGIPVLPIGFDRLPDGILSTVELGRKLGLPESPVLVLAGIAGGGHCALVVDQLDAVSTASGRKTDVWSVFDALRRETARFPKMFLLVGCREFDLEHDHRMRQLKVSETGFAVIRLEPLRPEQVEGALCVASIDPKSVQAGLKPILGVPLHLAMYLELSPDARSGVSSRDELFGYYWREKEHRCNLRLGRNSAWTQVIDRLTSWLSENQQPSAPEYILDAHSSDAAGMASEHVLVFSEGRYRFFHESFFDYAFARRFAATGGCLIDLLLGSEQHLFRRAQVRQVLAYLRAQDWSHYLAELEDVLAHDGVRFHIKSLVLQWLSSLPDPRPEEWEILQKVRNSRPGLLQHVQRVMAGNEGWFDVLDASGFFDEALTGNEAPIEQEAVWLLSWANNLKGRSDRIAEMLRQHRRPGDPWNQYLRRICLHGTIHHSPSMWELFLSLLDEGVFDSDIPSRILDDGWWMTLYPTADRRPELACRAIGRWFDRALAKWERVKCEALAAGTDAPSKWEFRSFLSDGGHNKHVIGLAAKAHRAFAEEMLPRVASFVKQTAENCRDRLQTDALWSFRSFGDDPLHSSDMLLCCLALSLEEMARTEPGELDRLLRPYVDQPFDAIAYLVLRAWTAAPGVYADRLAEYLAADPLRLKIGYSSFSASGGSGEAYVSCRAIVAASSRCQMDRLVSLEKTVLGVTDYWEMRHPQSRGRLQLRLLEAIEASRRDASVNARLAELRTKFPALDRREPERLALRRVGSPVPESAQEKMSDSQWLRAMRKYAGVEHNLRRSPQLVGGERELAGALERKAKTEPVRFARLAERMDDDFPADYYDAILRGVADCTSRVGDASIAVVSIDDVAQLVRRVHRLPDHPCGRGIAYIIRKHDADRWPDDILDAIEWYAINDPDPAIELWRTPTNSGQCYDGGDPFDAGINSVRGVMALAISHLLFGKADRTARLRTAVHALTHDPSVAVRACSYEALRAMLVSDAVAAITWFRESLAVDPVLMGLPLTERFIYDVAYFDYAAVRPALHAMLESGVDAAVAAAARQICLAALGCEAARADADGMRGGTPVMRKAAVEVYATNIGQKVVGEESARLLMPFFSDPEEEIRAEAAKAFRNFAELPTTRQAELLAAVLEAELSVDALESVVRSLEEVPVQLPDLVCQLAERCVDAIRNEAADISKAAAGLAMPLSKIVFRLCEQSKDQAVQARCLDLIDDMERYNFLGLSDELRRLDR